MKCRPLAWLLWGLIPVLVLIGTTLLGERHNIKADLTGRAQEKLLSLGMGWATPSFDGRDATLSGTTMNDTGRVTAANTVRELYGVRILDNRTGLATPISPYTWSANRTGNTVHLKGHAPSATAAKAIVDRAKNLFPDSRIIDDTKIARGTTDETWIHQTGFSLTQLKPLQYGQTDLSDSDLSIRGRARTSPGYEAIKNKIHNSLPTGLTLKDDAVLPPVANPFEWHLAHDKGLVTLDGHVPNQATRKALLARIKDIYPDSKVRDRMQIADGAPKKWLETVTVASRHAAPLQGGKADLTNTDARISGTVADYGVLDKATSHYAKATRNLKGFSHTAQLTSLKPRIPMVSPFTWQAINMAGILTLNGHVPGEKARASLLATAKKRFPGKTVTDTMTIARGAPKKWLRASRQGLARLSRLEHGTARISDQNFSLDGYARNQKRKQAVKPLDSALNFESRLAITAPAPKPEPVVDKTVEAVVPTEDIIGKDSARICENLIRAFLKKGKINFTVGKATITEKSHDLLDSLASVINKCPDTLIDIGGHTDSDGSDLANQQLSKKRAQAVFTYLTGKNIHEGRMSSDGYGEGKPLVPNDSPENKARNRRIEFRLRLKAQQ